MFKIFFLLSFLFFISSHMNAMDTQPKIVIVGAGLGGLTTAYRLHKMGYTPHVYEAKSRVGGRVYTVDLNGEPAELGGQNILDGGDSSNIINLINELQLPSVTQKNLLSLDYFDGNERVNPKTLLQKYNFNSDLLLEKFKMLSQTAQNMGEVMDALFPNDKILSIILRVMLGGYEGAKPEKLSLVYLTTLFHLLLGGISAAHQGTVEDDHCCIKHMWLIGGNSRLTDTLAKKVSPHAYVSHILKSISKKNNSFVLTFQNGKIVEADILVLAVPCTVYADIQIEKGIIPDEKLNAIKAVAYGTNSKVTIPVNCISEDDAKKFTSGHFVTFFPGRFDMLTVYYIEDFCSGKKLETVFKEDFPLIRSVFNIKTPSEPMMMAKENSKDSFKVAVGYSWPNDPFAKGSYSYIAAGQEKVLTQMQTVYDEEVKALFAPIENRLFFAGEHTSTTMDVPGTMESAVESGEKTARFILRVLK